jgi:hypothetical protein
VEIFGDDCPYALNYHRCRLCRLLVLKEEDSFFNFILYMYMSAELTNKFAGYLQDNCTRYW